MKKIKWTLEKIIEFIEKENYEFIEYISGIGKESRIKIWCKNTNHSTYEVIFNNFKRGTRCRQCYHEERTRWTDDKIEEYVKERGYKLLNKEGKGIKSKIEVLCSRGHKYKVNMFTFSRGHDCKRCFEEDNFTSIDEMLSLIESRGDIMISMSEYHGIETKFTFYCDKCDKCYEKTYEYYSQGGKCPYCSETRGEKRIRIFLEKHNIEFITQYRTDECKNKNPLPFDFYIKINDRVIMLEYDGIEHYQPINFFGGEDKFKTRRENDKIKNDYCESKNIELIRISYWDYNEIENILKKKLNLK